MLELGFEREGGKKERKKKLPWAGAPCSKAENPSYPF